MNKDLSDMEPVKVVLAGACGYGGFYLNPLLDEAAVLGAELVGVADPRVEQSERFQTLQKRNVPTFASLNEFYQAGQFADLVIIAAPIHWHLPLTRLAVARGACVLCEKPLAATADEASEFLALEKGAPGFIAIGYQWSFAPATQKLKKDVMAGRLGRAKRLKTMTLWPRTQSYYARNDWAGAMHTSDGTPVYDSPANNATAHYLHNMLYILGPATIASAQPAAVEAQLYRAKPIQNYDSAAIHVTTDQGADIFFYTTHAVKDAAGPMYEFEFEHATVTFGRGEEGIRARFSDGSVIAYGNPDEGGRQKIVECIKATRTGTSVCCGVQAAAAQTCVIDTVQKNCNIQVIPPDLIRTEELAGGDELIWAEGLGEAFTDAFNRWDLPEYPCVKR